MTIRSRPIGVRRALLWMFILSSSGTLKLRNLSFLGRSGSWPEIIADVHSLTETEIEHDGKRFLARSARAPLALRATGIALPPTFRPAAADCPADPEILCQGTGTGGNAAGASSPSDETELSCKERLCIAFGSSALHTPESCQAQKRLPIEPLLGALAPKVRNQ